ncbi:MAG: asparaginase [Deltaproteobacteria bacterium]|nr:asparaginase [Deltaproteobacteria bacterium]
MTATDHAVPLAEVVRSGRRESLHHGVLAVCDAAGRVVLARGEPGLRTYLRSSAKPFQAVSVLELGTAERLGLTEEELAVIVASHGAEPFQLELVASILRKAELTEEALQCGPHDPLHRPSAAALAARGETPRRVHNNCSGKHAGMLAACRTQGWPVESYRDPAHPLQERNRRTLAAFAGISADGLAVGVDGCGVPSFYLSLAEAATAFARLATGAADRPEHHAAATRVLAAMQGFPVHVAYEGHFGALLSEHLGPEVVAKGGAEGVFCLGLPGLGLGLACKILDGASRAVPTVVLAALGRLLPVADLEPLRAKALRPVKNTLGEVVGELRPVGL